MQQKPGTAPSFLLLTIDLRLLLNFQLIATTTNLRRRTIRKLCIHLHHLFNVLNTFRNDGINMG